jgi:hypothetical protein
MGDTLTYQIWTLCRKLGRIIAFFVIIMNRFNKKVNIIKNDNIIVFDWFAALAFFASSIGQRQGRGKRCFNGSLAMELRKCLTLKLISINNITQ